ncbi:MAG: hypothetical protein HEEMFOPI_01771 [Holosporales bacterium]
MMDIVNSPLYNLTQNRQDKTEERSSGKQQGTTSAASTGGPNGDDEDPGEDPEDRRLDDEYKDAGKQHHGNSKKYLGETHTYVIRDAEGNIHKVGESMRGTNKYGLSKRAEEQIRRLERQTDQNFKSEIRRWFSSKQEAREYETWLIKSLRERYGKEVLPGNKGVH